MHVALWASCGFFPDPVTLRRQPQVGTQLPKQQGGRAGVTCAPPPLTHDIATLILPALIPTATADAMVTATRGETVQARQVQPATRRWGSRTG